MEEGAPVYTNLEGKVHVFYTASTLKKNTAEQLTEQTKTFLTKQKLEFESAIPVNFGDDNWLNDYVEVTIPGITQEERALLL